MPARLARGSRQQHQLRLQRIVRVRRYVQKGTPSKITDRMTPRGYRGCADSRAKHRTAGMNSWPSVPPKMVIHSPNSRNTTCPASWNMSKGRCRNDAPISPYMVIHAYQYHAPERKAAHRPTRGQNQ